MTQLVEAFREIVASTEAEVLSKLKLVRPEIEKLNYQHGHYQEVYNTLSKFEGDPDLYNKKYPLIVLLEDVKSRTVSWVREYTFTMIICFSTKEDSKSQMRYDEVINPILQVIYDEFVKQILLSGYFYGYEVKHEMIIHPYMGTPGPNGNNANIFSDFLDSIEMRNVRLKMYPQDNCK